jgi:NAD(P)-dependent dehydrogenase (short-subunit alcohol dehydrogenase family)
VQPAPAEGPGAEECRNVERETLELKGSIVVVTGASGGIGRATAARLGEAGAKLSLAARNAPRLEATGRELLKAGAEILTRPTDVTRSAEVEALVKATLERFGRLDALVNAAGAFETAPVAAQDEEGFDRQIAVNLKSIFLACRAVAPHFIEQGGGHIVNVLSVAARQVFPENAAYCASKWGALGFTKVLAEELRPHGVRVTALLPGATDTPLWDGISWAPDRARMLRPDDVAQAILRALGTPATAHLEELVLTPPGGAL